MKYAFYSRSHHEKILKLPEFANPYLLRRGYMLKVKVGDSVVSATHVICSREYRNLPNDAIYVGEIWHMRDIEAVDPKTVSLITVPVEIG